MPTVFEIINSLCWEPQKGRNGMRRDRPWLPGQSWRFVSCCFIRAGLRLDVVKRMRMYLICCVVYYNGYGQEAVLFARSHFSTQLKSNTMLVAQYFSNVYSFIVFLQPSLEFEQTFAKLKWQSIAARGHIEGRRQSSRIQLIFFLCLYTSNIVLPFLFKLCRPTYPWRVLHWLIEDVLTVSRVLFFFRFSSSPSRLYCSDFTTSI